MKQKIVTLVIICVALLRNLCNGQVTVSNNSFTVNFPNIIQHNAALGNATASPQASAGQKVMWLEYGDGGFTTNPSTTHVLVQNPGWLLVSNSLYDTTGGQKKLYAAAYPNGTATTSYTSPAPDNATSLLTTTHPNILITSNVYDIVKADTMCFAVTYKLPVNDDSTGEGREYYLVFMYDNTAFKDFSASNSLTNTNIPNFSVDTKSVPYIRKYHSENVISNALLSGLSQNFGTGYNRFIVIKITDATISERNVFLTLLTQSSLPASGSTGIKAVLVSKNLSTNAYASVDQHPVAGMNFKTSHDPNYITQVPVCMQLPKTARTFRYHIHFQNTGEGEADKVKITAFMPAGIILNEQSFHLLNRNFATDQITPIHTFNQRTGAIVFDLISNQQNLMGTQNLPNPFVNPLTMGDIYFDMQATANTPDTMEAKASIVFHSRYGGNEPPVNTNTVRSYYSNCADTVYCSCMPDTTTIKPGPVPIPPGPNVKDTCTKILGICWRWWVIIAAGLVVIYMVIRKKKK